VQLGRRLPRLNTPTQNFLEVLTEASAPENRNGPQTVEQPPEMKGLEGSNPPLSANESRPQGFSAQLAEIARGCGSTQMVDGRRRAPSGSLRAERGRFLCWRVRWFHPFAARNGFNPNKRVGNDRGTWARREIRSLGRRYL
jgi:hypothetical protein